MSDHVGFPPMGDTAQIEAIANELVADIDQAGELLTQLQWWHFLEHVIRELKVRQQGAAIDLTAEGYIYAQGWAVSTDANNPP